MNIGPTMPPGSLLELVTPEPLADALGEYRSGDFLISSPHGSLLARGQRRLEATGVELRSQLPELFSQHSLVAGAIPFDPAQAGYFLAADSVLRGPQLTVNELPAMAPLHSLQPEASLQSYADAVSHALRLMGRSELSKIVLARSQRGEFETPIDQRALLAQLLSQNPYAYVFATALPANRTMLGASPELLIRRRGLLAVSNPLAGSLPRSFDPVLDRERAETLMSSAKDRSEHAIVVDMVAKAMAPFCRNLSVPAAPEILLTNSMIHLSTVIEGELREAAGPDTGNSALDLAMALHPTPAVCGWPTEQAREAIGSLEQEDRGFYAGTVGWMDSAGNGEWAVSIRCAELGAENSLDAQTGRRSPQDLRLFAGAGIVPGSEPLLELAETEAKFQTMLKGFGLSSANSVRSDSEEI